MYKTDMKIMIKIPIKIIITFIKVLPIVSFDFIIVIKAMNRVKKDKIIGIITGIPKLCRNP